MTDNIIISKIKSMPESLKLEALHYIEYLISSSGKEVEQQSPKFGSAKGMYKMSPDFDAPLDDFKEYM